MGDARRGRRRHRRAVVARRSRRSAAPARGSRARSARRRPPPRRCCEVVLPRLVNALARAGRGRARARRLPPALERHGARERRVVRRPPAGDGAARARPPAPTRRCRSARCAPTASCWSCGPTTCASRSRRPASSSTTGSGSSSPPADVELLVARTEGWPAGIYLAALSLAGQGRTSTALVARVRRHERARRRLPLRPRCSPRFEPELQAFMLRTSVLERLCAPLCDAVLGEPVSAGALESLARTNLFLLPLDDQRAVVPLPPSVRAAPARRAGAARAGELVPELHRRARTRGTASTARPTRRSSTRSRPARSREAGELIAETWVHYVNAGRTSSVLDWLQRFPAERARRRPAAAAGAGVDRRRCAASEAGTCARRWRACASSAGSTTGPLPDGFASLESSVSVLSAAFAWGDVPAVLERGRAVGASSRGPSRRGGRWSRGRSAGRTTATATSTLAERWLRETASADARDRAVDRRLGRDRRPVADRGHARAPRRAAAPGATRPSRWRASTGCSTRARSARCTPRRASRWARAGRATPRRCPSSSAASSCAVCGRQPLDLADGLIALAPAVAADRRPRARRRAVRRGAIRC